MSRAVIYRTADRPTYVRYSLPHLLQNTSPDAAVVIVENSSESLRGLSVEAIHWALENHHQVGRRRVIVHEAGNRIGGVNALLAGIDVASEAIPELRHVMVTDDDCLVPLAKAVKQMIWWDFVLAAMLDGPWVVAGHPWAMSFVRGKSIEGEGLAAGFRSSHVAGGCSGFRLKAHLERRITQETAIRGYGEWMIPINDIAYSAQNMVFVHFDRPEHPWSLRDTEYDNYSTDMYWERFPKLAGKERPKGSKGVW